MLNQHNNTTASETTWVELVREQKHPPGQTYIFLHFRSTKLTNTFKKKKKKKKIEMNHILKNNWPWLGLGLAVLDNHHRV